jgi:hypothetical protein
MEKYEFLNHGNGIHCMLLSLYDLFSHKTRSSRKVSMFQRITFTEIIDLHKRTFIFKCLKCIRVYRLFVVVLNDYL